MNAIDATALAIFVFEGGCHPLSRNVRNLNPGNLRPSANGQEVDANNYRSFMYFVDGWAALVEDIAFKIEHHLKPMNTMVDFFNLYAPGADHNDPHGYAQFVCSWLSKALDKNITIASTIGDIYAS